MSSGLFDTDGGVGAAQVAWFPAQIALAEGGLNLGIYSVLGGDMGVSRQAVALRSMAIAATYEAAG